jgi:hypothetical protein
LEITKFKSKFEENLKTNQDNEEWLEILKYSGLTPEELDRLSKNKAFARLIEAIEMLSKLLIDKNLCIRLLEQENENLNLKNNNLNKENITLFQQNLEFKKTIEKLIKRKDYEDDEGGLVNKFNIE